jgi:hypothetical protein
MAEADAARAATQGSASRGADPRADLLDVLIRGLETARASADRTTEGGEGDSLFCMYAYAEPGTVFCSWLYMHSVARA